jgi:hypothetical protein
MSTETIKATAQAVQQIAKMLDAADAIEKWSAQTTDSDSLDIAVEVWRGIHFTEEPFRTYEMLRIMAYLLAAHGRTTEERLNSYRTTMLMELAPDLSLFCTEVEVP